MVLPACRMAVLSALSDVIASRRSFSEARVSSRESWTRFQPKIRRIALSVCAIGVVAHADAPLNCNTRPPFRNVSRWSAHHVISFIRSSQ
jgi:hypothetical protein